MNRIKRRKGRKLPPKATAGLFETVRGLGGPNQRDFLISQFNQAGGLFRLPIPGVVVVANADDARVVYNQHHIKAASMYKPISHMASGPNLVSLTGGDAWHHRRKGVNPAFAPKRIKWMNEVALEKFNQWINEKLLPCCLKAASFNVADEMIGITIDVICKAALDYDLSVNEGSQILQAIKDVMDEFGSKALYNPLRCSWFLQDRRQALRSSKSLRTFAMKVIDRYRNNPSPTPNTVLEAIIQNLNYHDDAERVADIIMLLIAGHDTTGFTLAFALRSLAEHPEEQERLREEVTQCDGGGPYLKAVLNETMRMYNSTSLTSVRQLETDFVSSESSGNLFVPKGSIVLIAFVAMAHDPSVYPDPHSFQPSRWLPENVTDAAQKSFFPFSLGKRNCLGQPLAMAELRSAIPLLLRQFRFTVEDMGDIVTRGTNGLENCYLKVSKVA